MFERYRLLYNTSGSANVMSLLFPEPLPSGWMSEHNSMGFFGVKKRYPYPSGQRSYETRAIIDFSIITAVKCVFC